MKRPLVLSVAALACGCTAYTPVTPTQAAGGDQTVRVVLNEQGTVALAQLLGGAATELVGRVNSANDSAVTLGVSELTRMNGAGEAWNGEAVTVPLSGVTSVDRRGISAPRSALLAALITAGAVFAGRSFGHGDATGTHDTYGGSVR